MSRAPADPIHLYFHSILRIYHSAITNGQLRVGQHDKLQQLLDEVGGKRYVQLRFTS